MNRQRGVALPLVMLLVALLSVLLTQALIDVAAEQALVTQWQLRQSVFNAAGNGLAHGLRQWPLRGAPLPDAFTLVSGEAQAQVQWRDLGDSAASGYSADLFRQRHLELQSTASAARGAQLRLTVGLLRIEPR